MRVSEETILDAMLATWASLTRLTGDRPEREYMRELLSGERPITRIEDTLALRVAEALESA